MKPVEIILTVETRLFFVSVDIFKMETFESRLDQVKILVETVKIVRTNRDCQDLLSFVEIYQDISTFLRLFEGLQDQKYLQIEKA